MNTKALRRLFPCQTVHIDSEGSRIALLKPQRDQSRDHTGQNIPGTSFCHSGRPAAIDKGLSVSSRDHGRRVL